MVNRLIFPACRLSVKAFVPRVLFSSLLGVAFLMPWAVLRAGEDDVNCSIENTSIECELVDGVVNYSFSFDVENNSGYDVTHLLVPGSVNGVGVTFASGLNSLSVNLANLGTLSSVVLHLSGGNAGGQLCIPVGLMTIDPEGGGPYECCGIEVCVELPVCDPLAEEFFVRGDIDSDSAIQMNDGIIILLYLFVGGPPPACLDAADTNDDGSLLIGDAISVFQWLFIGGSPPVQPSPTTPNYPPADCGVDLTNDGLGCAQESVTCA